MTTTTLSNGTTLGNVSIFTGNTDLETNGAIIYIEGTVSDAGTFSMAANGNYTDLVLENGALSLTGGGVLQLSTNNGDLIYGKAGTTDQIMNASGTIQGGGQIGNGDTALTLTNGSNGVIDANAGNAALVIDTGNISLVNAGLIEATNSAGLTITDSIIDQTTGTLLASGSGDNIYLGTQADIEGGTLLATSGGMFQVNGVAEFDGCDKEFWPTCADEFWPTFGCLMGSAAPRGGTTHQRFFFSFLFMIFRFCVARLSGGSGRSLCRL